MDDKALVEAVKAAGHRDAADAVRDKALAGQLREAGHEALADALANGTDLVVAPEPELTPELTPEQQQGQAMLDQMRAQRIVE
jgi:hypothetical protein